MTYLGADACVSCHSDLYPHDAEWYFILFSPCMHAGNITIVVQYTVTLNSFAFLPNFFLYSYFSYRYFFFVCICCFFTLLLLLFFLLVIYFKYIIVVLFIYCEFMILPNIYFLCYKLNVWVLLKIQVRCFFFLLSSLTLYFIWFSIISI